LAGGFLRFGGAAFLEPLGFVQRPECTASGVSGLHQGRRNFGSFCSTTQKGDTETGSFAIPTVSGSLLQQSLVDCGKLEAVQGGCKTKGAISK
jgi:hypothetical protein